MRRAMRKFEYALQRKCERLLWRHPLAGCLLVFVGTSVLILASVCLCTAALALPMAWALGWM